MNTTQQIHIRVRSDSRTKDVAGAIAHIVRGLPVDSRLVSLSAIGPYAVNQAVKAAALANRFLYSDGLGLYLQPEVIARAEADVLAEHGTPVIVLK